MCLCFGVLGIYVYICASNVVRVCACFFFVSCIYNWGVIAVEGIRSPQTTTTTYTSTTRLLRNKSN